LTWGRFDWKAPPGWASRLKISTTYPQQDFSKGKSYFDSILNLEVIVEE
jgi:hypothetical protein